MGRITRALFFGVCLAISAWACSGGVTEGRAVAPLALGESQTLRGVLWEDAHGLFNGIRLGNESDAPVVLLRLEVIEKSEHLDVLGFLVIKDGYIEGNGMFSSACGPWPPPGIPTQEVAGTVIEPGESVAPIMGIANPLLRKGEVSGIRVTYRQGGDEYFREMPLDIRITDEFGTGPCNPKPWVIDPTAENPFQFGR